IQVPDLGTDDPVDVIEVQVRAGDTIGENDTLVVLESDKAAMDIPSPKAGVVKQVLVSVGTQVKTGTVLIELETAAADKPAAEAPKAAAAPAPESKPAPAAASAPAPQPAASAGSSVRPVLLPDLGSDDAAEVIDVIVKVGDTVDKEAGLITLETDKAAMDVPAPAAGTIKALKVKVGDKVKTG